MNSSTAKDVLGEGSWVKQYPPTPTFPLGIDLDAFKSEILDECQAMIERAMRDINCTCQKERSSTTDRLQDLVVQALLPEPIQPGATIMDDSLYGVAGIATKLYELDAESAESLVGNLGSTLNGLAEDDENGPVIRVPVVLRHQATRNGVPYWRNKPTWGYYRRVA